MRATWTMVPPTAFLTGAAFDITPKGFTVDVPFDQLPTATRIVAQRDFLREHGIDELVEEGRRVWRERAHIGDLEALKARSRVSEASALTDPAGLGAFRVLEWEVPGRLDHHG